MNRKLQVEFWQAFVIAVLFILMLGLGTLAYIESQDPPTPGSELMHSDGARMA
jgi:hypothetical protein